MPAGADQMTGLQPIAGRVLCADCSPKSVLWLAQEVTVSGLGNEQVPMLSSGSEHPATHPSAQLAWGPGRQFPSTLHNVREEGGWFPQSVPHLFISDVIPYAC